MARAASRIVAVPALLLAILAAGPAMADGAPACGGAAIDLSAALRKAADGVSHAWGRENLSAAPGASAAAPAYRVAYPAGSFSPGKGAIRGGAGFELKRPAARSACLSYKVRFAPGFDFAKGGKLPGLFGGAAPRGCVGTGATSGFSARLMWREAGAGELYLYAPGREQRCGASIGRGRFAFTPGRWSEVTQRARLGEAGTASDAIEVFVDGRLALRADGLTLGDTVDGLLFSTFFGGDDESWASPRDQHADFADVRLAVPAD